MNRMLVAGATFLAGAAVAGCSVTRYDADYAKAVERYRDEAPLSLLQAEPAEFAGGRIAVRMPQDFALVTSEQPAADAEPPDPSRLRPAFLEDFRGYEGTSERRLTVGNASLPVSLGVWAIPVAEGSRAALEKSLLDKARREEGSRQAELVWQDRPVKPMAGGPPAWRVLSLTGPQVFEAVVAGVQEYKPRAARCELWLSADPIAELRVLLVWRVPDEVAGSLPMPADQLVETLVRTVQVRDRRAGDHGDGDPAATGQENPAASSDKPAAGGDNPAERGPAAGF